MKFDAIKSTIRYILTVVGGVLVGVGVTDSDTFQSALSNYDAIIGGVIALAAFGHAVYDNIKGLFAKDKAAE